MKRLAPANSRGPWRVIGQTFKYAQTTAEMNHVDVDFTTQAGDIVLAWQMITSATVVTPLTIPTAFTELSTTSGTLIAKQHSIISYSVMTGDLDGTALVGAAPSDAAGYSTEVNWTVLGLRYQDAITSVGTVSTPVSEYTSSTPTEQTIEGSVLSGPSLCVGLAAAWSNSYEYLQIRPGGMGGTLLDNDFVYIFNLGKPVISIAGYSSNPQDLTFSMADSGLNHLESFCFGVNT